MAVADFLTTTRASTKYGKVNGVYVPFGVDTPALTDDGLLIEEARTNYIRNDSMQGAVVGVIGAGGSRPTYWSIGGGGGLTEEIVGVGVENGVEYIDIRVYGTAAGTFITWYFDSLNVAPAAEGEVWTFSPFYKVLAASGINTYVSVVGGLSGTSAQTTFSPDGELKRYPLAHTMGAGTTSAYARFALNYTNGAAVDATIRIGWPPLEKGGAATSPIRTTSAAVTRAADDITLTDMSFFQDGQPGTIFAEFVVGDPSATAQALNLDDGSLNNRITLGLYGATAKAYGQINAGGVSQAAPTAAGAFLSGDVCKIAMAFAENDVQAAVNGVASTVDSSATLPAGINSIRVGGLSASSQVLNAPLRRIAYWPARLSEDQLVALTQYGIVPSVAGEFLYLNFVRDFARTSGWPVTPSGRLVTIPADDRTVTIAAET